MAMLKPANERNIKAVRAALSNLREARALQRDAQALLAAAGAMKAYAKVAGLSGALKSAIDSVEGASRHVERRELASEFRRGSVWNEEVAL